MRFLGLAGLLFLTACSSGFKEEPRRYACTRDGGGDQCLGGWHCGLDGFCYNPTSEAPRRCDRDFERHAGYDCAPGWRCSVDGICFDARIESARPCNHDELANDAGPYDCARGWLCGPDNTCFNPLVPIARPCDRLTFQETGHSPECAPNWNCGLEDTCYDSTKAEPRRCSTSFDADGGNLDCHAGWLCSESLTLCYDPTVPEVRACDRDSFLLSGRAPECAPRWRCGPGFKCYPQADAGAHDCSRFLEQPDSGYSVGSDCAPGWRCGLDGVCQNRSVGAPYHCEADSDCEQSWRCNPITSECLLVTDRAPPATTTATPLLVSPRLNLGLPSRVAFGGAFSWPPPQQNGGGGNGEQAMYAMLDGNRLHLLVNGKNLLPMADGGLSRLIDVSCPVVAANVAALSAWQEFAALRMVDGSLSLYGFLPPKDRLGRPLTDAQGRPLIPDTCTLVASFPGSPAGPFQAVSSMPVWGMPSDFGSGFGIPNPPAVGPGLFTFDGGAGAMVIGLDGGTPVFFPGAMTPSNSCNTFLPGGSYLGVAGLTDTAERDFIFVGLTTRGLQFGQSVRETGSMAMMQLTPPNVCWARDSFGNCSCSMWATCTGPNSPGSCSCAGSSPAMGCGYDAGATYIRPLDDFDQANVALPLPPGFTYERLLVSERRPPTPGVSQSVVAAVGVVFAPLDGGVTRLITTGQVFAAPGSNSLSPPLQVSVRRAWEWPPPVPVCPGGGAVQNLAIGLDDAPAQNGGNQPTVYARCGAGAVTPDAGFVGAVIPPRTWIVSTQYPQTFPIADARYDAFDEDPVPFQSTIVSSADNHYRVFGGDHGRLWVYPWMDNASPSVPLFASVLDRTPDAVVRVATGPGSVLARGGINLLATTAGLGFFDSPSGLVGNPYVRRPGDFNMNAVGPVRDVPSLVIFESLVFDVDRLPFPQSGTPQVLATPANGVIVAPAVGELIQTQGRTRLYISSGDALWSADVTDQLANEFMPPASLVRSFSPVPGVALRSMAMANAVGADGGVTGTVQGYVIAGTDIYEFEGVPPFWSVNRLATNIGAGAPIDVFRRVDASGRNIFRVAFDTGVLAALPAPLRLTGPLPNGERAYRIGQLCGDTYALGASGLYMYGSGDGGIPDGGWTLVYPDAGTKLFESTTSFFTASPRGDVVEFVRGVDGGFPTCQ